MSRKTLYIIIGLVIVAFGALWWRYAGGNVFAVNTVMSKDYTIATGDKATIKDGAVLTIQGDLSVNGEINCQNGPIRLVVNGNVRINGKMDCDRGNLLADGDIGAGIVIVARGGLTLAPEALLETNGHVIIVDQYENIPQSRTEIDELYDSVARDRGNGNRVGPFVPAESEGLPQIGLLDKPAEYGIETAPATRYFSFGIPAALAAGGPINLGGRMVIDTPPAGIKPLVVLQALNVPSIGLSQFELVGPDSRDGKDDIGENCRATGADGQDSLRLLVEAPIVIINGFDLSLGQAGNGGKAETKKDCPDAIARGGTGGQSGNFKIVGGKTLDISGGFLIDPGQAGNGGEALAYGKDGDMGEAGGNAIAIGGETENNRKAVRLVGSVGGIDNLAIGSMSGGSGGDARAEGGSGGSGEACRRGGNGGDARAEGGSGGSAWIYLRGGGISRTEDARDTGGSGGSVSANGGSGGDGGACDGVSPGGNGRNGGASEVVPGLAGLGQYQSGNGGAVTGNAGGDGGDGGNGCPPGQGGTAGQGDPAGKDGLPGNDICQEAEPAE